MSSLHPGITGRKPADPSADPIAELPPLVSVKQTCAVLNMSRATIWRRVKDGTLQIASGSGNGRKNLVTKESIQRFAQPRATPVDGFLDRAPYSKKSKLRETVT